MLTIPSVLRRRTPEKNAVDGFLGNGAAAAMFCVAYPLSRRAAASVRSAVVKPSVKVS